MLRAEATALQAEIATRFGYTEVDALTSGPRDVFWCPDDIAFRNRQEQSSELGRAPEVLLPFLSFWRTGFRLNTGRMNVPLAVKGVPTDDTKLAKYKLVPLDSAYQLEFWADVPEDFEAAIEAFYRWAAPPSELTLTDDGGVTFDLSLSFGDVQDNSRITEVRDIGRIYRATFPMVVMGYVSTSGGTFKTIETVKWNIWDYSAYGTAASAVKIKEASVT